jgi:hypothetical protein
MNHEMKLGLQNYVVIIPIDNSYIKFNNNMITSLQKYVIAQNNTIKGLSQHDLKMPNHFHIQKIRQIK